MTDEERVLLIDRLFYAEVEKYTNLVDIDPLSLKDAANEIERLTTEVRTLKEIQAILARSNTEPGAWVDAEPVAWRYRVKGSSSWFIALKDGCDTAYWRASNYEVEPLYTAPRNDQWEK